MGSTRSQPWTTDFNPNPLHICWILDTLEKVRPYAVEQQNSMPEEFRTLRRELNPRPLLK